MRLGSKALPSLDPFDDIDPFIEQFDVNTDISRMQSHQRTDRGISERYGRRREHKEDENDEDVWVLPEKQRSAYSFVP